MGMATEIAGASEDDIDSRTATFDRKRPHDVATQDDNSTAGSAQSTPRKRKRHAAQLGFQDVRDFVPNGGTFTTDAASVMEAQIGDIQNPEEAVETSSAPPMTWNAVNNRKIRTSLGGDLGKNKSLAGTEMQAGQVIQGPSELEAQPIEEGDISQPNDSPSTSRFRADGTNQLALRPKAVRKQATKAALARLEAFRARLASMDPHDGPVSAYRMAQVEIKHAEIDYNYCLYYPMNTPFVPPPPITYEPGKEDKTAIKGKEHQIWGQIKECMTDGTLQDLREGRLPWGTGGAAQNSDIKLASKKLGKLLSGVRDNGLGGRLPSKEELQDGRSDANYCKFFPSNEEYLPLHRAKKGLQNPNDLSNGNEDRNRRAAQIWKLVQQCEANRTLHDLRNGRIVKCIRKAPVAKQPLFAALLEAGIDADLPRYKDEGEAIVVSSSVSDLKDEVGNLDPSKPKPPYATERLVEVKEDVDGGSSERNMEDLRESEATSHMGHSGSESDGDLVLNTYATDPVLSVEEEDLRGREEIKMILKDVGTNREDIDGLHESDGSDSVTDADSDSDHSDAMDGSDLEQATEEASEEQELNIVSRPEAIRTLAELNSRDLNAQLRYFHVTKSVTEIDRGTPVRCLVCSAQGHMADVCEQLVCSVCGAFNHHTTQNCPSTAKCSKCREMGHDKENCPYKLKNMAPSEIVCELCQRRHHVEADCELQWRTSGRPWEFDVSSGNVRLSCYECGRSGHLGNDCPTRRPGKSMGSSSWGSGNKQISIKSRGEISIKGTAMHAPIDIDDGPEETPGAFVRPKVPEPVRKGKIQIKTGLKTSLDDLGPNAGWNPVNAPYNSGRADDSWYRRYRDDGSDDWRPAIGAGQSAGNGRSGYESYRRSNRRSRSPQHQARGGRSYNDSYQPSRPLPIAEVYRPMPSSAQHAWSRHRV